KRGAAEPGHEGDSRRAASCRAGAHATARRAAGRLRAALRRARGSDGAGRLPGRPLRHAGGLLRPARHAPPLSGPGADRGRGRALRGGPSALSALRPDELPAGPARRAAGRGRRGQKAPLLHAERLLELGPVGEGYLTELIHARPHTWKGDVERLFALLEEVGEERFTRLLKRALFSQLFGAEYVV